jgi:transposase
MLYSDYTEELTGLKDSIVRFVERKENILHIHLTMEQRIHVCPDCGERTSKVNDYREQKIKDISSFGQFTIIHLRKRRHACPVYGKRFHETVEFLPRYHRITNRLYSYILNEFTETRSMKSIARSNNISQTTAARAVDFVSYTPTELPEVLSIDEFRGNSGGVNFQCILTNPVNKKIFDILTARSQEYLYWYFSKFKDRRNVKFVVMDMYKSYKLMAKILFPNATVIVDKYHFTRMVTWAFERVRIEE